LVTVPFGLLRPASRPVSVIVGNRQRITESRLHATSFCRYSALPWSALLSKARARVWTIAVHLMRSAIALNRSCRRECPSIGPTGPGTHAIRAFSPTLVTVPSAYSGPLRGRCRFFTETGSQSRKRFCTRHRFVAIRQYARQRSYVTHAPLRALRKFASLDSLGILLNSDRDIHVRALLSEAQTDVLPNSVKTLPRASTFP
jgi:hypothetical protein